MTSFIFMAMAILSTAALPPLTPASQAFIAPIHAAYARVEAQQAKLPSTKSPREKLERLYDLDQSARAPLETLDFGKLPAGQRAAAMNAVAREVMAHDLADQAALKALIPPGGWFARSIYGERGSKAAFLIVQHATNDPTLMRSLLPRLQDFAIRGEIDGWQYAYLYDRIAVTFDHKPQRYGSQLACVHGVLEPEALEDPAHVDTRRRAVGLKQTEAEYIKAAGGDPCT